MKADKSMPDSGTAATVAQVNPTLDDARVRLNDFQRNIGKSFEMMRREIDEANTIDFDGIEVLVKGASAETFSFSEALSKALDGLEAGNGSMSATAQPITTDLTPAAIHALAYETKRHYVAFQAVGEISEMFDELVEVTDGMRSDNTDPTLPVITKALLFRGQQLSAVATEMLRDGEDVSIDDADDILTHGRPLPHAVAEGRPQ